MDTSIRQQHIAETMWKEKHQRFHQFHKEINKYKLQWNYWNSFNTNYSIEKPETKPSKPKLQPSIWINIIIYYTSNQPRKRTL
jgi:hypothetical protein